MHLVNVGPQAMANLILFLFLILILMYVEKCDHGFLDPFVS